MRGVMAIDHTLVNHEGKLSEDVGWCWDHADEQHVIAHDYISSNYGCPAKAHYPIAWRRCKQGAACEAGTCKDHTERWIELMDDALKRGIPGAFTFASYFTSAKVLNHIHRQQAAYGGDLKLNRKVVYTGQEQKLQEGARQLPWEAKHPLRVGNPR